MSLIDNNTFLPGVITEVESDYSFGYDSSEFGSTDSIVILGTAFTGPVGSPVAIYNPEHARYIYGGAYRAESKRAATLVSTIEDAYQRGNRTIYGVRISGKEVTKDFRFNTETLLKLRVRSAYPSNEAKDFYLTYFNRTGEEAVRIYKPASRATVVEKMQGAVNSESDVLVLEIKLNQDYGITKDSLLVDAIQIINEHSMNNVLRLGISNEDGEEVSLLDFDARQLKLGTVFPGAYFIGRENITDATSLAKYPIHTDIRYTLSGSTGFIKPYVSFEDLIYKEIVLNTDVSSEYPIYSSSWTTFASNLAASGITSSAFFDFLEIPGAADLLYAKNKVDYDEVDIDNFDIYKRLGSGYAITAKAVAAGTNKFKIKETPSEDPRRNQEIKDGIYSMLENMDARYRVLSCVNADDKAVTKIPRLSDFQKVVPIPKSFLGGLINAIPKIDPKGPTLPKKYTFDLKTITAPKPADVKNVYTDEVITSIPIYENALDKPATGQFHENGVVVAVPNGTDKFKVMSRLQDGNQTLKTNAGQYVIVEEKLYKENGTPGEYDLVSNPTTETTFAGKTFIMSETNGQLYVLKLSATAGSKLELYGDIATMLTENEDETIIFSQSNYFEDNNIEIQSAALDDMTVEEFATFLNESNALKKLFTFELTDDGVIQKDEYVLDALVEDTVFGGKRTIGDVLANSATADPTLVDFIKGSKVDADREVIIDQNLYIPYKTPDNFVRQLAQHCTYTSLKTAPAHGIIGLAPLSNTGLVSVANRVEEAMEMDFDLYAKTAAGRSMLDRNNMPYPIGKNVSVTLAQYPVYSNTGEATVSNGAGGYAGMVSVLPLDQSSTNQPIAINESGYELTNYQLTRLTQKGFITFKQSYTRGLVVTDGITMAPAESPFRRLNVTRIISSVEELIREASEPFIGKQNNQVNRNSLHTAIKSRLQKIKGTLIEDFDFKLIVDPSVMKFAYIDIDYNIVPIYEIREVRNRIKVKDQL